MEQAQTGYLDAALQRAHEVQDACGVERELEASVASAGREALGLLVESVLPLLPRLAHSIKQSFYSDGHGGKDPEVVFHQDKGVVVWDNTVEEPFGQLDGCGRYVGSMVVLTTAGKFLRMTKTGRWSLRRGQETVWRYDVEEMTLDEVVRACGVQGVAAGLSAYLQRESGRLTARVAAMEGNLALLREAIDCLKKIRW